MTLLGIDVARYQLDISWPRVAAAGIKFAVAKATEGTTYKDPKFGFNWPGIQAAGIIRGAYHFGRPAYDAYRQARHFVSTVGSFDGSLAPVLDMEVTDGRPADSIRRWIRAFLDEVQRLSGRVPIIYTGPGFWSSIGAPTDYGQYPLWVAHYTTKPAPRLPAGWDSYLFWQYTSSGRVDGISTRVDMNRFQGTEGQLRDLAGVAPAPPTPPEPSPVVVRARRESVIIKAVKRESWPTEQGVCWDVPWATKNGTEYDREKFSSVLQVFNQSDEGARADLYLTGENKVISRAVPAFRTLNHVVEADGEIAVVIPGGEAVVVQVDRVQYLKA